MNYNSKSFKTT